MVRQSFLRGTVHEYLGGEVPDALVEEVTLDGMRFREAVRSEEGWMRFLRNVGAKFDVAADAAAQGLGAGVAAAAIKGFTCG